MQQWCSATCRTKEATTFDLWMHHLATINLTTNKTVSSQILNSTPNLSRALKKMPSRTSFKTTVLRSHSSHSFKGNLLSWWSLPMRPLFNLSDKRARLSKVEEARKILTSACAVINTRGWEVDNNNLSFTVMLASRPSSERFVIYFWG